MEDASSDGGLAASSYLWQSQSQSQSQSGWRSPSPYSIGSSSSGTTISTAYTSSGSRWSSTTPFFSERYGYHWESMEKNKQQTESLVQKLFGDKKILGSRALERWFLDLRIGNPVIEPERWICALDEIAETIRLMASLFPQAISSKEATKTTLDSFQFAQLVQITMLRMLPFVDGITGHDIVTLEPGGALLLLRLYEKLSMLLSVRGAVSSASARIQLAFHSDPSDNAQVKRQQDEIVSLLSAKEAKLGKSIWSMMEQATAHVLQPSVVEDDSSGLLPWSGFHRDTRSVMRHISFLQSHYSSVNATVSEAAHLGKYSMAQTGDLFPLNTMIVDMTACLEEKLVRVSKSFADQGLILLFLLNNLQFVREGLISLFLLKNKDLIRGGSPLSYSSLDIYVAGLFAKVDEYMDRYIQVSWAPMLACLFDPTAAPLCFGKNYLPLTKFESEFQKTYTTQKLWKVPDPKLRKSLRVAIVEAIVPGYMEYIDDNSVATPKFTPQELEKMLLELFEG